RGRAEAARPRIGFLEAATEASVLRRFAGPPADPDEQSGRQRVLLLTTLLVDVRGLRALLDYLEARERVGEQALDIQDGDAAFQERGPSLTRTEERRA